MKSFLNVFTIAFLVVNNSCCAQKMMQTLNDVQKLKVNESSFIDKPLSTLLREIGPEIKMVSANPSTSNQTRLGYLIFRFVDAKKYDSIKIKGKYPLQITVYVKEPFEWDYKNRSTQTKFLWAKEDSERLSNLTVVAIRVYGEN
jgi:hypothetical protein